MDVNTPDQGDRLQHSSLKMSELTVNQTCFLLFATFIIPSYRKGAGGLGLGWSCLGLLLSVIENQN